MNRSNQEASNSHRSIVSMNFRYFRARSTWTLVASIIQISWWARDKITRNKETGPLLVCLKHGVQIPCVWVNISWLPSIARLITLVHQTTDGAQHRSNSIMNERLIMNFIRVTNCSINWLYGTHGTTNWNVAEMISSWKSAVCNYQTPSYPDDVGKFKNYIFSDHQTSSHTG